MSEFFNWRSSAETATNCLALIERHAARFANLDVRSMLARPKKDGKPRKEARPRRESITQAEKAQIVQWEGEGRGRAWIAEKLSTTEAVISRHLRAQGIISRHCTKAQSLRVAVVAALRAGNSREEIARATGRSYSYICEVLRAEGLASWKQKRMEAAA